MKQIITIIVVAVCSAVHSQTWSPVGIPIAGTNHTVRDLIVYDNQLVVAGAFTTAGTTTTNRITVWDGSTWSNPFGLGLEYSTIAEVYDMCVFNGELIICGLFTSAGGITANCLARWDGSTWLSFSPTEWYSGVTTMTVFNNELYVAGNFSANPISGANHIAKWDGTSWFSVETGITTSEIKKLEVYDGNLYATGMITAPTPYIAKYNGTSWSGVGVTGLPNHTGTMAVYDSLLYIGVGTGSSSFLYSYDGTTLSLVPTVGLTSMGSVTIDIFQNYLVIGGALQGATFGPFLYDGITFTPYTLAQANSAVCFEEFNSELYAGWILGSTDAYNQVARLLGVISNEDNEITYNGLTLFPNPTTSLFYLQGVKYGTLVELIDASGRLVYTTQYLENGIDVSHLSDGIYCVRINISNTIVDRTLIINKNR